jgi:hypothetical protein
MYRDLEKLKIRRREQQQRARNKIRMLVREHKTSRGCTDCGIKHPAVLVFHHRDPTTKSFCIQDAVARKIPLPLVLEEMAKCDVLCANCHMIRHWAERAD